MDSANIAGSFTFLEMQSEHAMELPSSSKRFHIQEFFHLFRRCSEGASDWQELPLANLWLINAPPGAIPGVIASLVHFSLESAPSDDALSDKGFAET